MAERHPIVILTHEFYPQRGGIATYVQETARAATEMGINVSVWAPDHPELDERSFPFEVRRLPLRGTQDWSCRLRLWHYLKKNQQDWRNAVLNLPEPGPLRTWLYLQFSKWAQPKGLVVTLHGSEIERFSSVPHRRHLFRRLLKRADRVCVVSNYCAERVLLRYPELEGKVILSRGALRTDLPPSRRVSHSVETQPRSTVCLLTVARIHPRKGQLAVLEAIAMIEPSVRERILYRLVGPTNRPRYLKRLQEFAAAHHIRLQYDGALSEADLDAAYSNADIFALTSEPHANSIEGFGLAYLEASAYGLPILAHRVGGVSDAVSHGHTGLKVEANDRRGLAEAIRQLVENPDLRSSLGQNGMQWVRGFDWSDTVKQLFGPWI